MHNIWLVLKNEFINTVMRKSFILTLVLVPLVAFAVVLIAGALQPKNEAGKQEDLMTEVISAVQNKGISGYIDPGGIIKVVPKEFKDYFQAYGSEEEASLALKNGDIEAYYWIDPNYVETGKISFVNPEFNPLSAFEGSGTIAMILNENLLGNDQKTIDLVQVPIQEVDTTLLSTEPVHESGNMLSFFMPYAVMMLFYVIILSAASLLLNSITSEKQNRVMEILMTSMTPTQLLTGKIIALGLVGLLQVIFWVGGGYLLLRLSGNLFSLPVSFILPPSFLFWALIFFVLGYAIYATLMAGVGALVPNLREASQATTIVVLPMVVPLMFVSAISEDPNGTISTVLSLFPLTSPVSMMARLSAGTVPFLEILLSIAILVVTIYLVVRAIAGLFRAQYLLSGQSFRLVSFLKALIGKA